MAAKIQGCVALVTGAGNGIGRGLALGAAERGARVAVADIDFSAACETAAMITEAGGEAEAFVIDITDAQMCAQLAGEVTERFGAVNLLINNAGVFVFGRLADNDVRDIEWIIDVNLRGAVNMSLAFLPALRAAAGRGEFAWIVNTGSENSLGLHSFGPFTAYTATKHAIHGLSEGLRRDLADEGIGVSMLAPGAVRSELGNGKRVRQDRYGGAVDLGKRNYSIETVDQREPSELANVMFDALDAGEFLILNDPATRPMVEARIAQLQEALDACDARCSRLSI